MAERYDAAVAGGGPAGAVAALSLARRGWRVCLYDASVFGSDRFGETLPPEINPVLRELNLWDEFLALDPLESPGMLSSWGGVRAEQDFIRNPHGPGWHIDRNCFDEMLRVQAVAAGVDRFPRRAANIEARFLVDATGAHGQRVAEDPGREIDDRLLAIVLRAAGAIADQRTYIESAPGGWWYSAPLPGSRIVAMFFTDCKMYTREGIVLEEQLADAPLTRGRLLRAEILESRTVYASSSVRRMIAGDGWLAAGDAASSYDPLSGRGIFKALRHGQNAALAADAYLRGDPRPLADYAAYVRAEFDAYVRERRTFYATERRWRDREFWRARNFQPVTA
ncbi:MAG TPA: hypothetical protein VGF59_35085 [Bryobacteraceae bacterium]|jgi:flavin-dependent dehydrogenase